MRTREWEKLIRDASLDAFVLWLLEQPESANWERGDGCCCVLHDFVESVAKISIFINSPELHEHWADENRPTQWYDTPWWMTWILRSVDHSGSGRIGRDEVLHLLLILADRDNDYTFPQTIDCEEDLLSAV